MLGIKYLLNFGEEFILGIQKIAKYKIHKYDIELVLLIVIVAWQVSVGIFDAMKGEWFGSVFTLLICCLWIPGIKNNLKIKKDYDVIFKLRKNQFVRESVKRFTVLCRKEYFKGKDTMPILRLGYYFSFLLLFLAFLDMLSGEYLRMISGLILWLEMVLILSIPCTYDLGEEKTPTKKKESDSLTELMKKAIEHYTRRPSFVPNI